MPIKLEEVFNPPDQPYHPRNLHFPYRSFGKNTVKPSADHEKQLERFLNSVACTALRPVGSADFTARWPYHLIFASSGPDENLPIASYSTGFGFPVVR